MPHVYRLTAPCIARAMETTLDTPPQKRRSRMHRASTGMRLELTQRDLEIFKLLARYRYLRSTYIHAFVGGNKTKLIERLGDLYHEGGYLDRPEQQWEAVNARYMPVAYELGERGRWALADVGPEIPRRTDRTRQYRHEAMVCEIVASIELESRAIPGIRFISWEEILQSAKMPAATLDSLNPKAISAHTGNPGTSSAGAPCATELVPDAIFGIEYETGGKTSFRLFALEADRNTEPATRRDNRQSSYARKITQYDDVIRRALYRTRWGLPNLLVLTVTTSDRHMQALLQSVRQSAAAETADHFLFRSLLSGEAVTGPLPAFFTASWNRAGLEPLILA